MSGETVISVGHLTKRYGDLVAVNGLSFEVKQGEIFGMLGPNGAGKTTTIECIEGLRDADRGDITVLGIPVTPASKDRIQAQIGIQLQTTSLCPLLTVREVLELFASFYPKKRSRKEIDELIALVDLQEKANTRSKALSGGQKQRLSLALALVNDPQLVFLDEPTTGLDPQARRNLWEVIKSLQSKGKTVLMTTHYMEEAERLCDRVAIMDHGRIIVLDTPARLISAHFEETAVEFEANGAPADHLLQQVPGVGRVAREEGRITLYTTQPLTTLAGLMELSSKGAVAFDGLMVRHGTLEDVFLKLTGRRIRD